MSHRTLAHSRVPAPLIDVTTLLAAPAAGPTRIVEVSADPLRPPLLPGALVLGIADFAGPEGDTTGRQPLPDHEELVRTLRAAGVSAATQLLLYAREDSDLSVAARGWVTLRWAGANSVRVFGAERGAQIAARAPELLAWLADGAGPDAPTADGDGPAFVPNDSVVVEARAVEDRDAQTLLVDARAPEAFGDDGSHIPGAVNVPVSGLVDAGRLRDPESIRATFRDALRVDPGAQPLMLSCGSGIAASVEALALATAGVAAPVYIGSWSEWRKRAS